MDKIETLQIALASVNNSIDSLAKRVDTIEKATHDQLILLIAIFALVVLIVIYFVINEVLHWRKRIGEKMNHHHNHKIVGVEQQSNLDRLIKILPSIPKELEKLQAYKSKSDDYNNLEANYEKAINEKQKLIEQKSALEYEKKSFKQEIEVKENEINSNKSLLAKVKNADILKNYSIEVINYLDFLDKILGQLGEEIAKADSETAKLLSLLFQQASQKTFEMAKWKHICSDIIENGIAVQSRELKNCFQSGKDSDHLNAYKALCISNIKPIINAMLILCEANSNLSKFLGKAEVSGYENEFKNRTTEIISKAKNIGVIEIDKVNLFVNLGNSMAIHGEVSFPYSEVKNLNNDDIIQIIEFGMKTEFEELTTSRVLIQ